jgi:hypothetical protein
MKITARRPVRRDRDGLSRWGTGRRRTDAGVHHVDVLPRRDNSLRYQIRRGGLEDNESACCADRGLHQAVAVRGGAIESATHQLYDPGRRRCRR